MRVFTLLLISLFTTACSNKPDVISQSNITVSSSTAVYIVNHGWHTGFVIPSADIYKELPELKRRFRNTPYLEFGWGDRGFYQAREITIGLTLGATLWPTETVMHVVAVKEHPARYFSGSDIHSLCLSPSQYARLIDFIKHSFQLKNNDVFTLNGGLYGDSQFYQGAGDYYLFNTCNKWTAKGLKSAGFDIAPFFKLTADSIMAFLDETAESQHSHQCPSL